MAVDASRSRGRARGRRLRGARGLAREQVADIQRSRLLAAAVAVLDELGYEHTTVAHITSRAGVSRRTFYELFLNREACLAAILQAAAAQLAGELDQAGLKRLDWLGRMRGGLWELLCLLEREPALARVLLVHSAYGAGAVQREREAQIARLVALIDEGRHAARPGAGANALTAEGVAGAALAILRRRIAQGERVSLCELHGELSAMIVLPYLGAAAARREQTRAAPQLSRPRTAVSLGSDPLAELPMRLTYRTARALEGIARRPRSSNRHVGQYAGITDQGQISKLLGRLERLGLVANDGGGHSRGEPNAWTLTPAGDSIVRAIDTCTPTSRKASP